MFFYHVFFQLIFTSCNSEKINQKNSSVFFASTNGVHSLLLFGQLKISKVFLKNWTIVIIRNADIPSVLL